MELVRIIFFLTSILLPSVVLSNNASSSEVIKTRQERNLYKGFSGYRLFNNSFRMVYYHDLTIAVIEIGDGKSLLNCELIETFSDEQRKQALQDLRKSISRPLQVLFEDMMELINQCESLDAKLINKMISSLTSKPEISLASDSSSSQSGLLSWILPGTKWCGTGDIAKNYFDLGPEYVMDKCCRKHDLCPVKVKGYGSRYNLTNKSVYTKSHCGCDDELLNCLKSCDKSAANFMGNIYFNILQISCIADSKKGKIFRSSKRY